MPARRGGGGGRSPNLASSSAIAVRLSTDMIPSMPTDLIRYDLQVQDALRGVVRKVLAETARDGLPGEHHFYITFRTDSPGVRLSNSLREQYPDEMTIILQHQFWDLKVEQNGFEVGLHFKNRPERLYVPLDAISGFYDPSVQFGLKFESQTEDDAEDEEDEDEPVIGPAANRAAPAIAPRPRGAGSEPDVVPAKGAPAAEAQKSAPEDKTAKAGEPSVSGEESKVVSIDAFRKKP
jgi:hypothetical protein